MTTLLRYSFSLFLLLISAFGYAADITFSTLNISNPAVDSYKVNFTCDAGDMAGQDLYIYLFLKDDSGNFITRTTGQHHLMQKTIPIKKVKETINDVFTIGTKDLDLKPGKRYNVCLTASLTHRGTPKATSPWKTFTYTRPSALQPSQTSRPAVSPQPTPRPTTQNSSVPKPQPAPSRPSKGVTIDKVWLDMTHSGQADIYTKLNAYGYKGQKLVITYRFYDNSGKMVNIASFGSLKAGCRSAKDSYAVKVVEITSDNYSHDVMCAIPFMALEREGLPYSPKKMNYKVQVAVEDYNMNVLAKASTRPGFYFTSTSTQHVGPTKFYDPLGRKTKEMAQKESKPKPQNNKPSATPQNSAPQNWKNMHMAWFSTYYGAMIVGEGNNAKTIRYKLNGNTLTLGGYDKNVDIVLRLIQSNNTTMAFEGNDPDVPGVIRLLLDKTGDVLVIQTFMHDKSAMLTTQKYYSTIAARDKEIARNRSKVSGGNPSMPIPNQSYNILSDDNNNSGRDRQQKKSNSSDSRYGYIDCHLCHGSGVCSSCSGNGHLHGSYNYGSATCPNCLGATTGNINDYGKCKKCKGTGKVYGIK